MGRAHKGPVQKAARLLTKARAAGDRLCGGAMTRLVEDLRWKPDGMGGAGVQDSCYLLAGSAGHSDRACCHLSHEVASSGEDVDEPASREGRPEMVWYFHLHQGAARARALNSAGFISPLSLRGQCVASY